MGSCVLGLGMMWLLEISFAPVIVLMFTTGPQSNLVESLTAVVRVLVLSTLFVSTLHDIRIMLYYIPNKYWLYVFAWMPSLHLAIKTFTSNELWHARHLVIESMFNLNKSHSAGWLIRSPLQYGHSLWLPSGLVVHQGYSKHLVLSKN